MKTKIGLKQTLVLTIFLSLITTAIFAQTGNNSGMLQKAQPDMDKTQPTPPPPPAPPTCGPQGDNNVQPPVPDCKKGENPCCFLDIPGLTDEQKEKMKKADLKHMDATTPLKNQKMEKMAHLNTLLSSNNFNQKEANDIADEIGKIEASMLKEQIRHNRDIRDILTPDQRIMFDARPQPFFRDNPRNDWR